MNSFDDISNLKDKVALITGASGGIGRSIAALLAAHKVYVYLHYNANHESSSQLLEEIIHSGGSGEIIQCDLRDIAAVEKMIENIFSKRNIDILINNAGITRDSLLIEMKNDDFNDVLQMNLFIPFLCTKIVGKKMMENRSGKIVNISSVAAHRGGPGQGNYAAAKAALEAMTRVSAIEMGPFGINVNAVAPGIIQTDMTSNLLDQAGKKLMRNIPLKRFGNPADIAKVVLFLVSSLGDYITGQCILADGGYSLTLK